MYIPISIEAENLFSFQSMKYDFNNGVTTLINGENRDNDSQKSNGSGKSSLLEVMAIAITGTPLRKVKNEEIINDSADDGRLSARFANIALGEEIVINRQFFRKSSSLVSLQIFKDGKEIEDKLITALSSVDEYNKAILDRIGLTKDDIFSNFILSKSRYENFLLSSDTKKKETINQFSRGNAVDQALDLLRADMKPAEEKLRQCESSVNILSGKLELLAEQKQECIDGAAEKAKAKEDKITDRTASIADWRAKKRENTEKITNLDAKALTLDELAASIESNTEKIADHSPQERIAALDKFVLDNDICSSSFADGLASVIDSGAQIDDEINAFRHKISELSEKREASIENEAKLRSECAPAADHDAIVDKYDKELAALKEEREKEVDAVKKLRLSISELNSSRSRLSAKLSGDITCPKCAHVFLAADLSFDVAEGKKQLEKEKEQSSLLEKDEKSKLAEIEAIEEKGWSVKSAKEKEQDAFRKQSLLIANATQELGRLSSDIGVLESRIETATERLKQVSIRIDKYIEDSIASVVSKIDRSIADIDKEIDAAKSENERIDAMIKTLQEQIELIKNQEDDFGIKQIEDKISSIKSEKREEEKLLTKASIEYEKYTTQEQVFIDFKTNLANSKIKDLERITNDFLEDIGSDLRIGLSGYTKLKNGTIRDKISVSLLRNGMDAGSFGKLSSGEQARVSLANILALSKLINLNCDDGKGLDLLVLDEILESVDEAGLDAMLKSLNETKITCLVVSHGLIRESYANVDLVVKEGGFSSIERL